MGLFGTDGVRGVANTDLTPELAVGLGRALVRTLREEGAPRPRVVIGRDPRASGEMLEAALAAGICSAGGDAVVLDIVPTPGVAFLTQALGASAGAVISGSHNPVADNGIKVFGPTGFKLTDAEEQRIEELAQRTDEERPVGVGIGRKRHTPGAVEAYTAHLVASAGGADLRGLAVVVDCANGAASDVAPTVLRRLGARVTAIHAIPDGTNVNLHCGSTHPEVVAAAVLEQGADLGIAHDGDADRLICADHTGAIVDGDQLLAILAAHRHAREPLTGVVTTVMTNLGFRHAMEGLGIPVVETKVGDRHVLEAMLAGSYPLGGEQSGHLIFSDMATTGDGVLTAVQILATMQQAGRSLAELATVMARLPQVLVNVRDVQHQRLDAAEVVWKAVAAEQLALGGHGRVLVRPSGTEPMVRVMVEADSQERADAVAHRLAGVVRAQLG